MEQNGNSVRFGGNLMRFGSVSSQLDYYITTICADKGKCDICEFSISRYYEWSRNEKLYCGDRCEFFQSIAFSFTIQILKMRKWAMSSQLSRYFGLIFFNLKCTVQNKKDVFGDTSAITRSFSLH